MIELIIHISK